MNLKYRNFLPISIVLLTFVSVNQWSKVPIGNTTMMWVLYAFIIGMFYYEKERRKLAFNKDGYWIVAAYLIWAVIGIVRGAFVAENYWESKLLISNGFIVLFPFCVYAFYSPYVVKKTLRLWIWVAIPAFFLFFYWVAGISQFYLGPIYLLLCFLPIIHNHKWWVYVMALLGFLLLTYNIEDQRSQFLKAAMSFMVMGACYRRRYISDRMLRIAHWTLYVIPVVLLLLGLTGRFNIFETVNEDYKGQYLSSQKNEYGEYVDMSTDTRTFIYQEVITSAIKNKYVLFGRTPARGNDTYAFGDVADNLKSVKNDYNIKRERGSNEVCFPNIFTWLGLVGMLLYIGIYLMASYQGVYKSRNLYVKLLGVYVAFNFMYGWVENVTNFNILNINYWLMISICLSERFREMSNLRFEMWFNKIFSGRFLF